MNKSLIVILIILFVSACSTSPPPIDERLYQVCNDQPVEDAVEYDLSSDDVKMVVITKFNTESRYTDGPTNAGDGPVADYVVSSAGFTDKASLVLCVDKTPTDLVTNCEYQSDRVIEWRNASYEYSLRVAKTGEELISGSGELIWDEEKKCHPTAADFLFKESDTYIQLPVISLDPDLFDALEPFLTK